MSLGSFELVSQYRQKVDNLLQHKRYGSYPSLYSRHLDIWSIMSFPFGTDVSTTLVSFLYRAEIDDDVVLGLILVLGIYYSFRGILWDVPNPYYYQWFERPQEMSSLKQDSTRDVGLMLESSVCS
jgi:hypothetical protein